MVVVVEQRNKLAGGLEIASLRGVAIAGWIREVVVRDRLAVLKTPVPPAVMVAARLADVVLARASAVTGQNVIEIKYRDIII